jgi:hypothetical protein
MKQSLALLFTIGAFVLAGCCATPHVTRWEYKVTMLPYLPANTNAITATDFRTHMAETTQLHRERLQAFLNDLGKDGWMLIDEDEGTFYLKRPLK